MGGTVISGHGENESDAARHDSAERYVSCRTGRVQTERHAHERQFFARSARCPGGVAKKHPGATRCHKADVERVATSALFPGRGLGGLF